MREGFNREGANEKRTYEIVGNERGNLLDRGLVRERGF